MCTINLAQGVITPPSDSFTHLDSPSSTLVSPTGRDFERLYIHLDMRDPRQLKPSASSTRENYRTELSTPNGRRSTVTPTSASFVGSDIASSYTSMTAYGNFPLTYDSSLPTPVSTAGSPLPERLSETMSSSLVHQESHSQQPSPSNRPHAEWYSRAEGTQSASPMMLQQGQADLLEMHHGLRSQPQDVHSEFYYNGSFDVSVAGSLQPDSVAPADIMHSGDESSLMAGPLLRNHSASNVLGPMMGNTSGDYTSHYTSGHGNAPIQVQFDYPTGRSGQGGSSRVTKSRRNKPKPRPNRGSRRSLSQSDIGDLSGSPATSQQDKNEIRGRQGPRGQHIDITLAPGAREEDKFLFELRCELNKFKGNAMWVEIGKRHAERYPKKRPEALQMQLTRLVGKFGVWPLYEDEALREAYEQYEKEKWGRVLKIMREKGGCRAWDWKQGHIMKRALELGLEEFDPTEKKKTRRIRKGSVRRTSSASTSFDSTVMQHNGYGQRVLTSDQEDEILDFCKSEPESPDMPSIDENLPTLQREGLERDIGAQSSERVARQACEELISQHDDVTNFYASALTSNNRQGLP